MTAITVRMTPGSGTQADGQRALVTAAEQLQRDGRIVGYSVEPVFPVAEDAAGEKNSRDAGLFVFYVEGDALEALRVLHDTPGVQMAYQAPSRGVRR